MVGFIVPVSGVILMVLGVASGVALLVNALAGKDGFLDESGVTTLWLLFLLGLVFGIVLAYFIPNAFPTFH
jgi:hypothetical protein